MDAHRSRFVTEVAVIDQRNGGQRHKCFGTFTLGNDFVCNEIERNTFGSKKGKKAKQGLCRLMRGSRLFDRDVKRSGDAGRISSTFRRTSETRTNLLAI